MFRLSNESSRGFTLIELLVVIAIIAVIAAVVIILVNPVEIMKKSRDTTRLSDLDSVMKSVQLGLQNNTNSTSSFLCQSPATPPCSGTSNGGTAAAMRKSDGTGWIKINFGVVSTVTVNSLPIDSTNDSTYHYSYGSDGTDFEFNAVLEASQNQKLMQNDGGNNPNAYEIGSSLTVLN